MAGDQVIAAERPSGRRTPSPRVAEALVLALVAVAPLARGAVDTPVLLALAAAGAVGFGLLVLARGEAGLRTGRLAAALLVVSAFMALQLVPLPPAVLAALAPATQAVLDYAPGAPRWHPISLDPSATARELAKSLGWIGAFLVLQHQASASPRARRRALAAIGGSAALVALIGLAHRALGVEALFGAFAYGGDPPGLLTTFGNANNLAGFLAAGALVAFGLAADAEQPRAKVGWLLAGLVSGIGVALTESIGGIGAFVLGGLVFAGLRVRGVASRAPADEEREPPRSWAGFVLAALVVLAPLVVLYGGIDLTSVRAALGAEVLQSKVYPARVGVSVARSQPLVGTGRGTFETVHPRYLTEPVRVTYTHVENEPIQALAELGVFVGGFLVFTLVAAALALARGRRTALEAGAAAAVAALLVQGLVDFGLEFASGLVLLALLAAPLRSTPRRTSRRVAAGFALASLAAIALATPVALQSAAVDDAAVSALAARPGVTFEEVEAAAEAALARHPADWLPAENAAISALSAPNGAHKALPWLNRLLFLNPMSGRAHELTAEAMARLGRRQQALAEYRQAAELGADVLPRVMARFADPAVALEVAPLEPTSAMSAAKHLQERGRTADAITVLERSLETNPDATEPVDLLLDLLAKSDRFDRAVEIAHARRQRHPDDPHAWTMEANMLSRAGRPEARALYEEALRQFPTDAELVLAMAWHSLTHGAPEQALRDLMAMPPQVATGTLFTFHAYKGHGFRETGAFEDARNEYQLALQLDPENSGIWLLLAHCQLQLGALADARSALEHVRPDEPGAKELRARLAERQRDQGWNPLLGPDPDQAGH